MPQELLSGKCNTKSITGILTLENGHSLVLFFPCEEKRMEGVLKHSQPRKGSKTNTAGAPGWLHLRTSAFRSGHDPRVLGSSPASGSLLSGEPSGEPASPSACRSPCCALSPSDK